VKYHFTVEAMAEYLHGIPRSLTAPDALLTIPSRDLFLFVQQSESEWAIRRRIDRTFPYPSLSPIIEAIRLRIM
jgi:hypothetical protein